MSISFIVEKIRMVIYSTRKTACSFLFLRRLYFLPFPTFQILPLSRSGPLSLSKRWTEVWLKKPRSRGVVEAKDKNT